MRPSYLAVFSVLSLGLAACEPVDGGGGGTGGKFAFIRGGELITSDDSGDNEKALTDASKSVSAEPALSPNGQTIVFAISESGAPAGVLQTVPAAGGQRSVLATPDAGTTFGSPTWSPDGLTIVYLATTGADTHLFKIANGGQPEAVAPALNDLHFPAFLDANTLVVSEGPNLAVKKLDLASGALTDLGISSPSRVAPSPDGTRVAYAKADATTRIVVRDLATGTETPLATTGLGDVKPAFSPDGTFVAFDAKGPNEASPKIYAARSDGTSTAVVIITGSDVTWGP